MNYPTREEILMLSYAEKYTTTWVDEFDKKQHSLDSIALSENEHDLFLTLMDTGIEYIRKNRDKNNT